MKIIYSRLKIAKRTLGILLGISLVILTLHFMFLVWQTPWILNLRGIENLNIGQERIVNQTEYGTIITNREEFKIDYVPLTEIPDDLTKVFLAIEDSRFYQHGGIDIWGVIRAVWMIATDQQLQGGSTISQQLARNIFLTHDRT
ncbi:MAG: biosynthetic peptidoglycan transglycosylase, partial [Bacillota bacterium]|nr:biosynthetic peptidoglycan transglycosylase [Bacillota bacterium]